MFTLLVLFAITQVVVGPATNEDETDIIADLTNEQLQELLKVAGNAETVRKTLNLLQTDSDKAKKQIQKLKKKKMSKEMKWLINTLIKAPQQTYKLTLGPALSALHKKLEEESTTYRSFAGPVRNLIEGAGYTLLRLMGFSVQTTAALTQVINNIVKDCSTAYYGYTPHEERFNAVDKHAEKAKNIGARLSKDGEAGVELVISRTPKGGNNGPASDKADTKSGKSK